MTSKIITLIDDLPFVKINEKTKSIGKCLQILSNSSSSDINKESEIWATSQLNEYGEEERNEYGNEYENIHLHYGGLIESVVLSYSYHRILVLSPDDFWTIITQQIGTHILNNSEQFRDLFVSHQGVKDITVNIDLEVLLYGEKDSRTWTSGINKIIGQLNQHIGTKTMDTFTGTFSTTTHVNSIVNKICIVNTMKNYFAYKMMTMCGIPQVEMTGNQDDWQLLIDKTHRLHELINRNSVTDKWFSNVHQILQKLYESYCGDVDFQWWSNILSITRPWASGQSTTYNGWITQLPLYDSQGNLFQGNSELTDFPLGVNKCPFIYCRNMIENIGLNLVGGHIGSRIRETDGAVVPVISYGIL